MTKRQFLATNITTNRERVLPIDKNNPLLTTATVYDRQDRILSVAQNNFKKTHPIQAKYAKQANIPLACFLHAEVLAIIRALKRGVPYRIKVERYLKNGRQALAKPCPICQIAIKEAGIRIIDFTVTE